MKTRNRQVLILLLVLVLSSLAPHGVSTAGASVALAGPELSGPRAVGQEPVRLGPDGAHLRFMAVAGVSQKIVYAATLKAGLYRLSPGAQTWERTGLKDGYFSAFAVNPRDPSKIICCMDWGRVLYSHDGGVTWAKSVGVSGVGSFAFDAAGRVLYALLQEGSLMQGATVVYRSLDGGRTWSLRGRQDTAGMVATLYVDPRTDTLILGLGCSGVEGGLGRTRYSTDGGRTWKRSALEGVLSISSSSGGGEVFSAGHNGLARSRDGGRTWSGMKPGFKTTWVAPAFTANILLVTGDEGSQAALSTDGGRTWTSVVRPPGQPEALVSDGGRFLLAAGGKIWASRDGREWEEFDREIRGANVSAMGAATAGLPRYVGTAEGRLYRLDEDHAYVPAKVPEAGAELEITRIWPSPVVDGLAFLQLAPVVLVGPRPLFRTTDGGSTWAEVTALKDNRVSVIAFDPENPDIVWAGVALPFSDPNRTAEQQAHILPPGLYGSRDGGVHFEPAGLSVAPYCVTTDGAGNAYAGSPDGIFVRRAEPAGWLRCYRGLPGRNVTSVQPDPFHDGVVYAATSGGPAVSRDGGLTWECMGPWSDTGDAGPVEVPTQIIAHPGVEGLILARATGALWYSFDGGASWCELAGLPGMTGVVSIVPDSESGLYVVTAGAGTLWWRELPHSTPAWESSEKTPEQSPVAWSTGFELSGEVWWDGALVTEDGAYVRIANELFYSQDGERWLRTADLTPLRNFFHLAGAGKGVLYGVRPVDDETRETRIVTNLLRSDNNGNTWQMAGELPGVASVVLPTVGQHKGFSLAGSAQDSETIVVSAYLGQKNGVWWSKDAGATWHPSTGIPLEPYGAVEVWAAPASGAFWAMYGRDLYSSVDGGTTFRRVTEAPGGRLVLGPYPWLYSGEQVSQDGGSNWRPMQLPLWRQERLQVLRASPTRPGLLLGGHPASGGYWHLCLSTDGGISWRAVTTELGNPVATAAFFAPGDRIVVIAKESTGRSTVYSGRIVTGE